MDAEFAENDESFVPLGLIAKTIDQSLSYRNMRAVHREKPLRWTGLWKTPRLFRPRGCRVRPPDKACNPCPPPPVPLRDIPGGSHWIHEEAGRPVETRW